MTGTVDQSVDAEGAVSALVHDMDPARRAALKAEVEANVSRMGALIRDRIEGKLATWPRSSRLMARTFAWELLADREFVDLLRRKAQIEAMGRIVLQADMVGG